LGMASLMQDSIDRASRSAPSVAALVTVDVEQEPHGGRHLLRFQVQHHGIDALAAFRLMGDFVEKAPIEPPPQRIPVPSWTGQWPSSESARLSTRQSSVAQPLKRLISRDGGPVEEAPCTVRVVVRDVERQPPLTSRILAATHWATWE